MLWEIARKGRPQFSLGFCVTRTHVNIIRSCKWKPDVEDLFSCELCDILSDLVIFLNWPLILQQLWHIILTIHMLIILFWSNENYTSYYKNHLGFFRISFQNVWQYSLYFPWCKKTRLFQCDGLKHLPCLRKDIYSDTITYLGTDSISINKKLPWALIGGIINS